MWLRKDCNDHAKGHTVCQEDQRRTSVINAQTNSPEQEKQTGPFQGQQLNHKNKKPSLIVYVYMSECVARPTNISSLITYYLKGALILYTICHQLQATFYFD